MLAGGGGLAGAVAWVHMGIHGWGSSRGTMDGQVSINLIDETQPPEPGLLLLQPRKLPSGRHVAARIPWMRDQQSLEILLCAPVSGFVVRA